MWLLLVVVVCCAQRFAAGCLVARQLSHSFPVPVKMGVFSHPVMQWVDLPAASSLMSNHRPGGSSERLRVGVDGSGLLTVELALKALSKKGLITNVELVMQQESRVPARTLAAETQVQQIGLRSRTYITDRLAERSIDSSLHGREQMNGGAVKFHSIDRDAMDIYFASLGSYPVFRDSQEDKELLLTDESLRVLQTIQFLRPKIAFVVVPFAKRSEAFTKKLDSALATLKSYTSHTTKIEFGKFCKLGVQRQVLVLMKSNCLAVPGGQFGRKFDKRIETCQTFGDVFEKQFVDFFKEAGVPAASIKKHKDATSSCTCTNTLVVCPMHRCNCWNCTKKPSLRCSWRKTLRSFAAGKVIQAKNKDMLARFRKLKRDANSLPTYFTAKPENDLLLPKDAALIELLQQASGISSDKSSIVDLSVGPSRCLRMDGSVPPPTDQSMLFVPSTGKLVNNRQLLLCIGLPPDVFQKVDEVKVERLVATSIPVPVAGALALAALSLSK